MFRFPLTGLQRGRLRRAFTPGAMLLCLGLTGCVEAGTDLDARTSARSRMAALEGVSPRGAPVAFASVEGAPSALSSRFTERTRREAEQRDIVVTDAGKAKYLVRGYLSAFPASSGVTISYVWDVFDARHARVQRVEDALSVPGSSSDPWALVDEKALTSLASKSADDLAAILSNMPEAIAAARSNAPGAVAAMAGPSVALPPSASAFR